MPFGEDTEGIRLIGLFIAHWWGHRGHRGDCAHRDERMCFFDHAGVRTVRAIDYFFDLAGVPTVRAH